MVKTMINVPEGTRYLSELVGRELPDGLPRGIFNKSVCDCGATTIALTDEHKTILCSPRVKLLENKRDWCKVNEIDVVLVKNGVRDAEVLDYLARTACPKILVTYDSLSRVAGLISDKTDWRVVVDEFHVLLSDSGFKSEVEFRTLECLGGFSYVTYMSATPMLDEFVEQIPQFKSLPYVELEWPNPRKVKVERLKAGKPLDAALDIINRYRNSKYIEREINGEIAVSKECVIFLNSVKGIVNLVANSGLMPEDVNIIVADTDANRRNLKALSKKMGLSYEIGGIPLKDEPHKLITLCTSTVYAGCDFWSKSAATFVICDSSSKNQIVDIGTELMQIAGRQRDPHNKFRDIIFFVYKTSPTNMREEMFRAMIDKKRRLTSYEIEEYENAVEEHRELKKNALIKLQQLDKYSEHYAMWDSEQECIVFNNMAYLYDRYAYRLQVMFKDGINVSRSLSDNGFDIESEEECLDIFAHSVVCLIKKESFADRMKEYCKYRQQEDGRLSFVVKAMEERDDTLAFYYHELGGDRIKALCYKESSLKNAIRIKNSRNTLEARLSELFSIGTEMAT